MISLWTAPHRARRRGAQTHLVTITTTVFRPRCGVCEFSSRRCGIRGGGRRGVGGGGCRHGSGRARLELPFAPADRARRLGVEPLRDALQMESVRTLPPDHGCAVARVLHAGRASFKRHLTNTADVAVAVVAPGPPRHRAPGLDPHLAKRVWRQAKEANGLERRRSQTRSCLETEMLPHRPTLKGRLDCGGGGCR